MSVPVHVTRTDALVEVTLTAPDRRNALSVEMLDAIAAATVEHADASVLLLRGEGRVFCSGFDLDAVRSDPAHVEVLIEHLSQTCRMLRRCPATTLAVVQGAAVAGGCALAVACDILVAHPEARFGYPVHALGISPAVTLPVLLPTAGGRARSLLLDGTLREAAELHDAGIVHGLLGDADSFDAQVDALLSRGTAAAHATKTWLNELEGAYDDARFDGPVEGSRGLRMQF